MSPMWMAHFGADHGVFCGRWQRAGREFGCWIGVDMAVQFP
jgi:hypothetical protein